MEEKIGSAKTLLEVFKIMIDIYDELMDLVYGSFKLTSLTGDISGRSLV